MSMLDKVVAAVTPPESDEQRREARQKALTRAGEAGWLDTILQHHQELERAFAAVAGAGDAQQQRASLQALALLLNGHSIAEEIVLYPALVVADEKAHSTMSYTEQSGTKVQMAELEMLPPLSREFVDKLEHIRGAVLHHMYEEENNRFLDLLDKLPPEEHQRLTARFHEEYERYTGGENAFAGRGAMAGSQTLPRDGAPLYQ